MARGIKLQAEYLETGENAKRSLCTGHMSHRVLEEKRDRRHVNIGSQMSCRESKTKP